jgi:hypothetical protein
MVGELQHDRVAGEYHKASLISGFITLIQSSNEVLGGNSKHRACSIDQPQRVSDGCCGNDSVGTSLSTKQHTS